MEEVGGYGDISSIISIPIELNYYLTYRFQVSFKIDKVVIYISENN